MFDPKDVQSYLGHWNPPQAVRECRKLLEPKADLRLYDTVLAMDDLDDVSNTNLSALEATARDYLLQASTRRQLRKLAALL